MRISFDNSDDLAAVLSAVGAVYGVQVVVAPAAPTPATDRRASPEKTVAKRTQSSPPVRSARSSTRRSKAIAAPATASQIRAWADATGHQVSSRGRIPASVTAAYQADHGR